MEALWRPPSLNFTLHMEGKKGCLGLLFVAFAAAVFLAWLMCDISPYEEYGWMSGIWHGFFFPENWIRSLFSDALFKAPSFSGGYNFFFWLFAILSTSAAVIWLFLCAFSIFNSSEKNQVSSDTQNSN